MKKLNLKIITNAFIIIWLLIWLNFAVFNWDVFIVKLNVSLGYTLIHTMPFVFFFFAGLVILAALRYLIFYNTMKQVLREKDYKTSMTLKEKEIEILKLKEVLFKMQTSDMNKNATDLKELNTKLDLISNQFMKEKEEKIQSEKNDKPEKQE